MSKRLLSSWGAAGAWFGLLEGVAGLHLCSSIVGDFGERAVVVATCVVADALALAVLALVCAWPARIVARVGRLPVVPCHVALVVFSWIGIVGAILFERIDSDAPIDFAGAALGVILGVSALASVVAGTLAGRRGRVAPDAPPRIGTPRALGAFVVLALAAISIGWSRPHDASAHSNRSVILISLDTLRADHLGCHGYERGTSPHLDALARRSILFENAYSTSHWTLASHASMLTGLDPLTLGILDSEDSLHPVHITLAERFAEAGYRTAAFVGGGPFSHIGGTRGLDQGFQEYHHVHHPDPRCIGVLAAFISKIVWRYFDHRVGTATNQISQANNWLRRHQNERFFLFVHLFDIHSDDHCLPYDAPQPYLSDFAPSLDGYTGCGPNGHCASRLLRDYASLELPRPSNEDIRRMIELYDAGIAYTDAEVGRLLATIQRLGLDETTAVVLTSDHGEAFFEHGRPLHTDLHHENLHVPLIVSVPHATGGARVAPIARGVDVAPTILELAGLANEADRDRSLLAWLRDEKPAEQAAIGLGWKGKTVSIRTPGWKYIRSWDWALDGFATPVNERLYDAGADLVESVDLAPTAAAKGALAESLREQAVKRANLGRSLRGDSNLTIEIPEHEIENLRALGYVK